MGTRTDSYRRSLHTNNAISVVHDVQPTSDTISATASFDHQEAFHNMISRSPTVCSFVREQPGRPRAMSQEEEHGQPPLTNILITAVAAEICCPYSFPFFRSAG